MTVVNLLSDNIVFVVHTLFACTMYGLVSVKQQVNFIRVCVIEALRPSQPFSVMLGWLPMFVDSRTQHHAPGEIQTAKLQL